MSTTYSIREATARDWPAIWAVLEPVFRAGETYTYAQDISVEQARQAWMESPAKTLVCVGVDGAILGSYAIRANQPGQGSHVCNCGYVVSELARGQGIATALCEHSQALAREMGFRAMQFNLVVSTNEGAVRLWQRLGYRIVGTLPEVFRHPRLGFVDAFVMYKDLAAA